MEEYRQVKLKHGYTEMVVNMLDHPKLKIGNIVTLKDYGDPKRYWRIEFVSDHTRPKSQLNRSWNNNI